MSEVIKHLVINFIPGLGNSSVNDLVALGMLEAGKEFSPGARRDVQVVTRASVDAFAARYVALGELCQVTGLHHKKVRQRLRLAGVDHAFPYEAAGAFFYPRASAEAAMALAGDGTAPTVPRARPATGDHRPAVRAPVGPVSPATPISRARLRVRPTWRTWAEKKKRRRAE